MRERVPLQSATVTGDRPAWAENNNRFSDRRPIPNLLQGLFGKFFADRGYVSKKLANQLLEEFGIHFFAKPRRNMRSRAAQTQRASQSCGAKHQCRAHGASPGVLWKSFRAVNFCVNVLCGLIAYWERARTRRVINWRSLVFVFIGLCLNLQRCELRLKKYQYWWEYQQWNI